MIRVVDNIEDPLIKLIEDDPVRPEISKEFRISSGNQVFVLVEGSKHLGVLCVAYREGIPSSVEELLNSREGNRAVFYTIWSYKPGSGRQLIVEARSWISSNKPGIDMYVTLSPPTELARKFHLSNGAKVGRFNEGTVNYIYD